MLAKVGGHSTWLRPDAVQALLVHEDHYDGGWSVYAAVHGRDPDIWLGRVESKEEAELRMADVAKELLA